MDGEEVENGEGHCCQLQRNERIKYQWGLGSKYKTY